MYLTRLTLDPRSAQARRDLGDAYEMHRTLVRAFVDSPQSEPPRFLWRLEASKDSGANPTVLCNQRSLQTGRFWKRCPTIFNATPRANAWLWIN